MIMLSTTTVAPVGVDRKYEHIKPVIKQITEITAEVITTDLKCLHTRIADSAGNIIRLEINNAPIILIPKTIVTAVKNAISIL